MPYFFPLTSPLPTGMLYYTSKLIYYMELSKEFGTQKKIQTGRSLYCADPNDHQVTSTFVKLCAV